MAVTSASLSNPPRGAAAASSTEESPLLSASSGAGDDAARSAASKTALLRQNLLGNPKALITQIACLALLASVLTIVIPNPAGLFSYHPPLQTLSIVLFVQGVLTLQPTSTKHDKARGLALHQIFQILGLAGIAAGVSVMIANKALHGAKHFTSWHGLFGLITSILLVVQALIGALLAYKPGFDLFGSEEKAKSFWKYHRASGYLILPLSLLTASLATSKADWVLGHSSTLQRVVMTGSLAVIALGLWSGMRLKKLGLKH